MRSIRTIPDIFENPLSKKDYTAAVTIAALGSLAATTILRVIASMLL